MSIRMLAREIYRCQQQIERYEKALNDSPLAERSELEEKLRQMRAEKNQLRRALDGRLGR